MRSLDGTDVTLPELTQLVHVRAPAHFGWAVLVGDSVILTILGKVVSELALVKFHYVRSTSDALEFLARKDATLLALKEPE